MAKSAEQVDAKSDVIDELDWSELSGSDDEDETPSTDPLAGYVLATPRAIAILCLGDCHEQLERWSAEPLRLAIAAKSSHLAMQAALTDALAGTASLGVYNDKHISDQRKFYEDSRAGEAKMPAKGHVMGFSQLLDKAMKHPLPWSGKRLDVSPDEKALLDKLRHVRHSTEHPHPESHFIEPFFISQTLPVAARLTQKLLEECSHHGDDEERQKVADLVEAIATLCVTIETASK